MSKKSFSVSELESITYEDIISDLQTGAISLTKTLSLNGKIGGIFQRIFYRINIWIILGMIRRCDRVYGESHVCQFADFVRDSIVAVFSTLGPANYYGDIPKSACQIHADGLTRGQKIRLFGMSIFRLRRHKSIIVPVDITIYEYIAKYIEILDEAEIKIMPMISDSNLDGLDGENLILAERVRDLFAQECLLAILDGETKYDAVVLCYDMDNYRITPSPKVLEQEKSLLAAFASVRKIDVDMSISKDKHSWYDPRRYYIVNYVAR